ILTSSFLINRLGQKLRYSNSGADAHDGKGGTPMVVEMMNFPIMEGVKEREEAIERRFRRRAVAPSEIWEELLAAEVPVSLNPGGG
ncbi:MAG: hypothetical protein Q9188_006487, partial [Gyalolechia gomerana]